MENASKALIMAGSILIGIMLISIAVYLFNLFGNYSSETNQKIIDQRIEEFNSQFTKYEGSEECSIHDIITIAHLAYENNKKYEYYDTTLYPRFDNTKKEGYYVSVIIEKLDSDFKEGTDNFEYEAGLDKKYNDYIKEYSLKKFPNETQKQLFKCTKVNINLGTKLVNEIKFEKLD